MNKSKIWLSMRILVVVAFLATIPLNSCCVRVDDTNNKSEKSDKKQKITETDYVVINGTGYSIIKVDGHSYLSSGSHGGIIHLESCYCKQ